MAKASFCFAARMNVTSRVMTSSPDCSPSARKNTERLSIDETGDRLTCATTQDDFLITTSPDMTPLPKTGAVHRAYARQCWTGITSPESEVRSQRSLKRGSLGASALVAGGAQSLHLSAQRGHS